MAPIKCIKVGEHDRTKQAFFVIIFMIAVFVVEKVLIAFMGTLKEPGNFSFALFRCAPGIPREVGIHKHPRPFF